MTTQYQPEVTEDLLLSDDLLSRFTEEYGDFDSINSNEYLFSPAFLLPFSVESDELADDSSIATIPLSEHSSSQLWSNGKLESAGTSSSPIVISDDEESHSRRPRRPRRPKRKTAYQGYYGLPNDYFFDEIEVGTGKLPGKQKGKKKLVSIFLIPRLTNTDNKADIESPIEEKSLSQR